MRTDDKLNIIPKNDSLALVLVDYYEHKGDKRLLPKAYYYAGRTYLVQNNNPQALFYYQKATDAMEIFFDPTLGTVLNIQIAYILKRKSQYSEAARYFNKALLFDSLKRDTLNMIYDYRDIAFMYDNFNKDSSAILYQKALHLAEKGTTKERVYIVLPSMANSLREQGRYLEALQAIYPVVNVDVPEEEKPSVYYNTAIIFDSLEKKDSAYKYYTKTLHAKESSAITLAGASWNLAKIAKERMNVEEMYAYLEDFLHYQHLVDSTKEIEAVISSNAAYNYRHVEKEREELKIKNIQKENAIVVLIIILFSVVALSVFSFLYYRQRKELFLARYNDFISSSRNYKERTKETIARNNKKIEELNEEIARTKDVLRIKEVQYEKQLLKMKNEEVNLAMGKTEILNERFKDSSIYKTITEKIKSEKPLTSEESEELEKTMKTIFPDFSGKLLKLQHLSKLEICISFLIRTGFKPGEIAILTAHAPQSITSTRRRLYKKVFGKEDVPGKWDEYILSL
jgi:hypothetical protein